MVSLKLHVCISCRNHSEFRDRSRYCYKCYLLSHLHCEVASTSCLNSVSLSSCLFELQLPQWFFQQRLPNFRSRQYTFWDGWCFRRHGYSIRNQSLFNVANYPSIVCQRRVRRRLRHHDRALQQRWTSGDDWSCKRQLRLVLLLFEQQQIFVYLQPFCVWYLLLEFMIN